MRRHRDTPSQMSKWPGKWACIADVFLAQGREPWIVLEACPFAGLQGLTGTALLF
jgi:hypothetical protein